MAKKITPALKIGKWKKTKMRNLQQRLKTLSLDIKLHGCAFYAG